MIIFPVIKRPTQLESERVVCYVFHVSSKIFDLNVTEHFIFLTWSGSSLLEWLSEMWKITTHANQVPLQATACKRKKLVEYSIMWKAILQYPSFKSYYNLTEQSLYVKEMILSWVPNARTNQRKLAFQDVVDQMLYSNDNWSTLRPLRRRMTTFHINRLFPSWTGHSHKNIEARNDIYYFALNWLIFFCKRSQC